MVVAFWMSVPPYNKGMLRMLEQYLMGKLTFTDQIVRAIVQACCAVMRNRDERVEARAKIESFIFGY